MSVSVLMARQRVNAKIRWRLAAEGDGAMLEHYGLINERCEGANLVQNNDDSCTGILEVLERVNQCHLRLEVNACHGLVEHEQLGLADQSTCDQHTLLLTARERSNVAMCQVSNSEFIERRHDTDT